MHIHLIEIGRNEKIKKISATFVASIMVLTVLTTVVLIATQAGAVETTIWTTDEFGNPKTDFAPGDIVYIHGSGFTPGETVDVSVTRPDGEVEIAPGGGFPEFLPIVELDGTFSYEYDLDGIYGLYIIDATDGFVSATTTFTDGASVDFSQYANLAPTYEKWIGSILQSSNSVYYEGMSVPQRTVFVDIEAATDDVHSLTFSHQSTKGGIHAYDWLTSWNQGNIPPLNYIPWGEDIGPKVTPEICGNLHNQTGANEYILELPDDPYISKDGATQDKIDAYELLYGNRFIRICGNQSITSASITFSHDVANGDDTGDSYIDYEITWTSASDQILIEMGGHLAMSGNASMAWGPGLGAAQISGGPYHFKLNELDDHALGSQDNQIKGADILVIPGTIIVEKQTIPDASGQTFTFTGDAAGTISDGQQIVVIKSPGTYTSTEIVPNGWELTSISITENGDQDSTYFEETTTFNLQQGETITAVYTNTQLGSITIVKNTNGGDGTFDYTGTLGPFSLTTSTGTASTTYTNLLAGTYYIEETVPGGWNLSSITGDADVVNGNNATIHLEAGEDATVTFTNTKKGSITIVKNTNGGDATFDFTSTELGPFSLTTTGGTDSITFTDLEPGTYYVTETEKIGWELTSITGADSYTDRTATITIAAGGSQTVTFTNTRLGTIIVEKQTIPDGSAQTFTFTGNASGTISDGGQIIVNNLPPGTYTSTETVPDGWELVSIVADDLNSISDLINKKVTFHLEAGETVKATFTNGQLGGIYVDKITIPSEDPQLFTFNPSWDESFELADLTTPYYSGFLEAGTYSISEVLPSGWHQTSAICSDGSSINNIELDEGETIVITFTNTKLGTIIVEKQTIPDGLAQTFTFTGDASGSISDNGQIIVSNLLPGTYTSTETVPAGWKLTGLTADDANSTVDLNTKTVTFKVEAGETVKATFTNTKLGSITVEKQTYPDGDLQQFNFTGDLGEMMLTDDSSATNSNLMPGIYNITEIVPTGWDLLDIQFTDGDSYRDQDTAVVNLEAGEDITVTFYNIKYGKIIVEKQTDPDGATESFEFNPNWTGTNFFLQDGQTHDSGLLYPGPYSVEEINLPTGWALNYTTGADLLIGNTAYIDLLPGETVTVVFNNSYNAPPIQEFIVGDPNTTRIWRGNEYYVVGACTPLTIISSDPDDGSNRIEYSVWLAQDLNATNIVWDFLYSNVVYDQSDEDEDDTEGIVKVTFYLNETCFHEILYQCWDNAGNTEGNFSIDLFVDKCAPVTTKTVGCPSYGAGEIQPYWITDETPLVFTAFDKCCLPNGTGVEKLHIKVRFKEDTCTLNGSMQNIDYIIIEDQDLNDDDVTVGQIEFVYELLFSKSGYYEIEFWSEDGFCNIETHHKQQHLVDIEPPKITKTHPKHGYMEINETYGYLKSGAEITLEAEDMPNDTCNVGLAGLYYRYEWNDTMFPEQGDPDAIYGGDLVGDCCPIDDQNITCYLWYLYDSPITFDEECQHDLYYFAIDNLCNYGEVHHQTYYVDLYCPTIELDVSGHGYIPINDTAGRIKAYKEFYINATDIGADQCTVGIESIFLRYDYDGVSYPDVCEGQDVISGDKLVALYGEDYNTSDIQPYCWYKVDNDSVLFWFEEKCIHNLSYFAKDNLCHRSQVKEHTFYVDDESPELNFTYPDHGHYITCPYPRDGGEYASLQLPGECVHHLKCNTTFTVDAYDLPDTQCMAEIESMFYRYEWLYEQEIYHFPSEGDADAINGSTLYDLYGYTDPNITDYWWYRIDDDTVDISFPQECVHQLYIFAKDKVCHASMIYEQTYYVDCSPPDINITYPDHGYYSPDCCEVQYLKTNVSITLNAWDLPYNDCQAGIETIFFRYEWNGDYFPGDGNPYGYDTIPGSQLVTLYGSDYNITSITGYNWFRVNASSVDVWFNEQCQHDFYYFTKDNLCHHSDIYHETYLVDDTLPTTDIVVSGHGFYNDTLAQKEYLSVGKHFTLTAADTHDCAAGIETIFYRYEWYEPTGAPHNYPEEGNIYGYDEIDGSELVDLYGEDYNISSITEFRWFRINASSVEVWFNEECQHDLYWFAKDNVCHRTEIYDRTFFIDGSDPATWLSYPQEHGYYYDEGNEKFYIKCGKEIEINTFDLPENLCAAGVEGIFYRYEYNGQSYPQGGDIDVTGAELAAMYGYTDPDIINYNWTYVNDTFTTVSFNEDCIHKLFWFTKDFVCHNSGVFNETFYVDCTGPYAEITYPDHGYWQDNDEEYLKAFTTITISAEDTGSSSSVSEEITEDQELIDAIFNGTYYLSTAQNTDGSWGTSYKPGHTGLVLIKLQDFAYEQGYSPFDPDYVYYENVIDGWQYLFSNAEVQELASQDHTGGATGTIDDPDTNGNDIGIYFGLGSGHETYETGICLMALVASGTPDRVIDAPGTFVDGMTFKQLAQDTVDWLAMAQTDWGSGEGGWNYGAMNNNGWRSDNSMSGYAVLGLTGAESSVALPGATPFICTVPSWVKTELDVWIDYIQNDANGGSGYTSPDEWINELKTGNLLSQMAFYGDSPSTQRFKDAMDYIEAHWQDQNNDPGWGYNQPVAHYQAMFTLMKAFETNNIKYIDLSGLGGSSTHDWYQEFMSVLLYQQNSDGSWPAYDWGDNILNTAWALFTLEKIAPQVQTPCASGIESIFYRYEWTNESGVVHFFPDEPDGTGIVDGDDLYNDYGYEGAQYDYYWYRVDDDIVDIEFEHQCTHDLYFFAKDNVCNPSQIYNKTYYVDNTEPSINLTVEGHGYYEGDADYLRVGKTFSFEAEDNHSCAAGIETIFERYEWINETGVIHYFPQEGDPNSINGTILETKYGYSDPETTDYWWYYFNGSYVESFFMEECEHILFYWAKDNVCHRTDIYNATFLIDDSNPEIYSKTPDEHGYYYNETEQKMYMRVGKYVDLFAYDLPDYHVSNCGSGLEATFWRYEWNDTMFPAPGETGEGIRSGQSIAENYSYYDTAFIGYNWYTTAGSRAMVYFEEECIHDLYFWAKDNVCHNSTMHHETYYVDNSSPDIKLTVGDPNCTTDCIECDGWCITNETEITLTAYDLPDNQCKSGLEGIFWRYTWYDGEYPGDDGEDMNVLNGITYSVIPGPLIGIWYGYEDAAIIEHDWYFTNSTEVILNFTEECTHVLYYWAKDNVCHPSEIYCANFSVDLTPPPKPTKTINGFHAKLENPKGYPEDYEQWMVFPETEICFNATDDVGPHECGPLTIEYRIWYLGTWTNWTEYEECISFEENCLHILEARVKDCLGHTSEVDNESFWVCGPGGDTGPDIMILDPSWGDDPHCETTLEVIIDASDSETNKEDLQVILWIPGGRRDAPTLWYYPEYNVSKYGDEYFHAFIDIYKYQNGAELTLEAIAIDGDYNVESSIPVPFTVCSTVVWDQWMQPGWNRLTLPFGAIDCDDSVEGVLDSIDGYYDLVFHYSGGWSSYVAGEPANTLNTIFEGKDYWIHISSNHYVHFYIGPCEGDLE